MSMNKKRIDQAVWNNAVWCDVVCRAHGNPGVFAEGLWYCPQEAPPFYPNSVTLDRSLDDPLFDTIQGALDKVLLDGWAVKDSYANLALSERGFQALFDAEWIYLDPTKTVPRPDLPGVHWDLVTDKNTLAAWEQVWADLPANETESQEAQIFQPALLTDERLSILVGFKDHRIVAGVIGLLTDGVVGVSNLFGPPDKGISYRAGCISGLQEIYPNTPLVGYEGGADLKEMGILGFERLGLLRIWVRDSALTKS